MKIRVTQAHNRPLYLRASYWFGVLKDIVRAARRCFQRRSAIILMYHSVGYNDAFFTVTPEAFAWQISYLAQRKYHVISLTELVARLQQRKSICKKTVVITFDDGYLDNLEYAVPILERYRYPATLFVITGDIQRTDRMQRKGISMLLLDELKQVAHRGVDVQPHTVTHTKLNKLTLAEQRDELIASQTHLKEMIPGVEPVLFAYPSGIYTDDTVKLVCTLFQGAVTVNPGSVTNNTNPFLLPRHSIDSYVDKFRFVLKLL